MLGEIASVITIIDFIGKILKNENKELSNQITHGVKVMKKQETANNKITMNTVIDSFSHEDNSGHLILIANLISKAFEDNYNKDSAIYWGDFLYKAGDNISDYLDDNYRNMFEYIDGFVVMERTKNVLKKERIIPLFTGFKNLTKNFEEVIAFEDGIIPSFKKISLKKNLYLIDTGFEMGYLSTSDSSNYSYYDTDYRIKFDGDNIILDRDSRDDKCFQISNQFMIELFSNMTLDIVDNIMFALSKHEEKIKVLEYIKSR